jgi:hypothetical protein
VALLVLLIIIGVIVYFVMTSGEDTAEETPSPEETTSMWQGEPSPALVLAATAPADLETLATLRSA